MKRIIGNKVKVFLKGSEKCTAGDIYGLLIDVTEDNLYVQGHPENPDIFVIPRENVCFCTTHGLPSDERQVVTTSSHHQMPRSQPQSRPQETRPIRVDEPVHAIDRLRVFVNEEMIAEIPVPPTFPIAQWNDKIMKVISGNPDVRSSLAGKIQRGLEYYPGEVYIEVEAVEPPSQIPESSHVPNSFSMGGSPITTNLNPSQMAARLNKVVSGQGKKDDDET